MHEAGHAVVAAAIGLDVEFCTIHAGLSHGRPYEGLTKLVESERGLHMLGENVAYTEMVIRQCWAGTLAEVMGIGASDGDWHEDMSAIADLAMRISGGPDDTNARIEELRRDTEHLLEEHWAWVSRVADSLTSETRLTGSAILKLRPD